MKQIKPHFYFKNGLWHCRVYGCADDRTGYGATTFAAWLHWVLM